MFRAIRRHVPALSLGLTCVAVLGFTLSAGLAAQKAPTQGPPRNGYDGVLDMDYGPDEIVYLMPEGTPVRFADVPRPR